MASSLTHPSVQSAVRFEDVTTCIGKRTILDRMDLKIDTGEIAGILGPNGAGKTTVLSTILGLRPHSTGTVTVLGYDVKSRNVAMFRRIGVVLQETALYDELTTFENLRFAATLFGLHNSTDRIDEALELLDLSDKKQQRVGQLSGGMRRRVTIARALLHSPDLLIIDEPTLGVDVEARHVIWSHLRSLRAQGTSVIVTTNYLDEVLALCDSVVVLRDGTVVARETPQALVARAGSCLDIECSSSDIAALEVALTGRKGVLRTNQTSTGLAVYLDGEAQQDAVMRRAFEAAPVRGFRLRAADLAEVFRAIETST